MFSRKGSVRRFLSTECTKPQLALFQLLKDEQAKYAKVKSLQAMAIEMDQLGKHEKPIRAICEDQKYSSPARNPDSWVHTHINTHINTLCSIRNSLLTPYDIVSGWVFIGK